MSNSDLAPSFNLKRQESAGCVCEQEKIQKYMPKPKNSIEIIDGKTQHVYLLFNNFYGFNIKPYLKILYENFNDLPYYIDIRKSGERSLYKIERVDLAPSSDLETSGIGYEYKWVKIVNKKKVNHTQKQTSELFKKGVINKFITDEFNNIFDKLTIGEYKSLKKPLLKEKEKEVIE
jgi:hypothetical protein